MLPKLDRQSISLKAQIDALTRSINSNKAKLEESLNTIANFQNTTTKNIRFLSSLFI